MLKGEVAFLAVVAEGRTDVAFTTGLDPSPAVLHLKEEGYELV